MDPIPVQNSKSLAQLEEASTKYQIAEVLLEQGRHPGLAEFAIRAPGDTPQAKVRYFLKAFDKIVAKAVDDKFAYTGNRVAGQITESRFIAMAREAQDENIPSHERDGIIQDMISAIKQNRVR